MSRCIELVRTAGPSYQLVARALALVADTIMLGAAKCVNTMSKILCP